LIGLRPEFTDWWNYLVLLIGVHRLFHCCALPANYGLHKSRNIWFQQNDKIYVLLM